MSTPRTYHSEGVSMSSEAAETNGLVDPDEINWHAVWRDGDREPYEQFATTKLSTQLIVSGYLSANEPGHEVVSAARDEGLIEPHPEGSGFRVAGCSPPVEKDADTDEAEQPDEVDEPSNGDVDEDRGESETEPSTRQPEIAEQLAAIREAQEQQQNAIDEVRARVGTLESALADFAAAPGNDAMHRDEFAPALREQRVKLDRLDRTIEAVAEQMDELGSPDEQRRWSEHERVHALRQHVVSKNQTGKYGMDYNDVRTFFDGREAGISKGYANSLIDTAAEEHDAFYVGSSEGGNKQLRVEMRKIGEGSVFQEKNSSGETGG